MGITSNLSALFTEINTVPLFGIILPALIDAFHGTAKSGRPLSVPRENETRDDYLDRKNKFEISSKP